MMDAADGITPAHSVQHMGLHSDEAHGTARPCDMKLAGTKSRVWHVCVALGMSDEAYLGWAKLHVHPHQMCLAFFASIVAFCVSGSTFYSIGLPWPTLIIHVPWLFNMSTFILLAAKMWRGGPLSAAEPVGRALMIICAMTNMFIGAASFVGPDAIVPFGDQIASLIGYAGVMWCALAASALGASAPDHPPQPYSTLLTPLTSASFSALRCLDIVTDLGFVRILLHQGPECMWFGAAVPCSHYTHLAITAGCIAAVSALLTFAVTMLGGQQMLFSSAGSMFKVAVSANTGIMLCELGGITIATLKVFSDKQSPEGAATARLRREAAFAIASALSTLASFCVNVLGMQSLLRVLRGAAASVRAGVGVHACRRSAVAPDAPAEPPPNPSSCDETP